VLGRSTKATLRLTELFSYRSDILDLSKVEAANIDLEAIALSQADSVHGGGSIASRVALDKGLALDDTIEPDVPVGVRGDPSARSGDEGVKLGSEELNTELLLELFDGDAATVDAILTAAMELIEADAQRIEVGLDTHDARLLIEAAHRLKGTAGSLHANTLLERAAQIETAMKQDSRRDVGSQVGELRCAIVALGLAIEAYRAAAKGFV
jgi:HPt (histidine-containing phosphotransfer) domain-containing protein